jgi:hypothetical protein
VHGAKVVRLLNEIDKMSQTERSFWARMVGLITGKLYPYREESQIRSEQYNLQEFGKEVSQSARAAAKSGKPVDMKEVERLRKLLEAKQREYQGQTQQ